MTTISLNLLTLAVTGDTITKRGRGIAGTNYNFPKGSKLRRGTSIQRPVSSVRQKFDSLSVPSLNFRETLSPSSPSSRNLSISSRSTLQHSRTSLNSEEIPECVSNYGWNGSDQGLRLQKHLSQKYSVQSMRRVSEMVHHRLDPMYKINGSKVTLQDRYCVDGVEMQKLQEMTITREEILSDLRKMKYHNGPRTHINQTKYQKQNNAAIHLQNRRQPPAAPTIYPPTPTSDYGTARNNDNVPNQMSQQSEEDIIDVDDDCGGDLDSEVDRDWKITKGGENAV